VKSPLLPILFCLVAAGVSVASPNVSESFSKRILGRWLGPRKFVVFHSDGTWGVQRHETAPEEIDGRRWRIEGNKLILTYPGNRGPLTSRDSIISFTPQKLIVQSEDGYKEVYEREP
jgi:hypothetical protein